MHAHKHTRHIHAHDHTCVRAQASEASRSGTKRLVYGTENGMIGELLVDTDIARHGKKATKETSPQKEARGTKK